MHLAWGSVSQVSAVELIPSASILLYCVFRKEVTVHGSHLLSGEFCSLLLESGVYTLSYLRFCEGHLSFRPYSLSVSFIYSYGLKGIYFIHWVIIQNHFYLFCLNCSSSDHWELFKKQTPGSLWHFDISWSVCVCVCVCVGLFHFIILINALGSSCVIHAPALTLVHFSRNPGSFYWKMVLETKMWTLGNTI